MYSRVSNFVCKFIRFFNCIVIAERSSVSDLNFFFVSDSPAGHHSFIDSLIISFNASYKNSTFRATQIKICHSSFSPFYAAYWRVLSLRFYKSVFRPKIFGS